MAVQPFDAVTVLNRDVEAALDAVDAGVKGGRIVELALRAPDGVKSLTAAKVSAPKEAAEAKLIIECAAATAPGKHACTVEAKCGWNGEELLTRREIVVEIKP